MHRALYSVPLLLSFGCAAVQVPNMGKATRFDPGRATGRAPAEALPADNVDARLTDLKNGHRAIAWSVCDEGGCLAKVGLLKDSADGLNEVAWARSLRLPQGDVSSISIEGIHQEDVDDDGEGEILVVYRVEVGRTMSRRMSIHDVVDLRLMTVVELERTGPDKVSCPLHIVDANGDGHRDLVSVCSDRTRPIVRTWRRSRDEWR